MPGGKSSRFSACARAAAKSGATALSSRGCRSSNRSGQKGRGDGGQNTAHDRAGQGSGQQHSGGQEGEYGARSPARRRCCMCGGTPQRGSVQRREERAKGRVWGWAWSDRRGSCRRWARREQAGERRAAGQNNIRQLRCAEQGEAARRTAGRWVEPVPDYQGSRPSSSVRRSRSSSEKASEFESPGAGLGERAGDTCMWLFGTLLFLISYTVSAGCSGMEANAVWECGHIPLMGSTEHDSTPLPCSTHR